MSKQTKPKKVIFIIILIGIVVLVANSFIEREPKFWVVEKDGVEWVCSDGRIDDDLCFAINPALFIREDGTKEITPNEAIFKLYGLTCDEVWAEIERFIKESGHNRLDTKRKTNLYVDWALICPSPE